MPTNLDRFWAKVDKSGDCWLWTAAMPKLPRRQYGTFTVKSKPYRAHRWIYEQMHGPIATGIEICHHCDNPRCVRPDHLFAGSKSDNMMDSARKGRNVCQKRTHCPNGHSLSGEHLMLDSRGHRKCRTCQRVNQKRYDANRLGYAAGEGK